MGVTYEVWVGCRENCENWEPERPMLETTDPVTAIASSIMHRDMTHWSEIRIKKEGL